MSSDDVLREVAERFLSEDQPELRQLVAEGLAPLPPQQLLVLQVELARSGDDRLEGVARASLLETDAKIAADVLEETANAALVEFYARESKDARILGAILRRRDVETALLEGMAVRLNPELQELLLLRQDAIVERPEILDSLEQNPDLSSFSGRRIAEYRTHLVPEEKEEVVEEPPEEEAEVPADGEESLSVEAIQAEFDALGEDEDDEDLVERLVSLTEAEIRGLPVPDRLKLSRRAPRSLRGILIRDQSPMVALAVLRFNRLTDSEVEQVVNSRAVLEDVLAEIGRDTQWARKYSIVHSLVKNPKSPRGMAMRFVSRLSVRHLRELSGDRNAPEAIRSQARRLYTMKTS